jgi:phage-related protein
MDREADLIRQQMEATRTSLADKLEALQCQVVGSVQATTSAVTGTVDAVRDTIKDAVDGVKSSVQGTVDTVTGAVNTTVDTVKNALDFRSTYESHPWLFFGGSILAGYACGAVMGGAEDRRLKAWTMMAWDKMPWLHHGPHAVPADYGRPYAADNTLSSMAASGNGSQLDAIRSSASHKEEKTWLSGLNDMFGSELDKLKGLAIGALFGVAKNMIRSNFAGNMSGQLAGLVDSMTTKLGGTPVEGPVFKSSGQSQPGSGAATVSRTSIG